MRKHSVVPAVIALLLICYIFLPYLSLFNLYVALKSSDSESVEKRIAWDTLREGMRTDLDKFIQSKANTLLSKKDIKVSWKTTSFTKQMTDKIATPDGLIYLFHNPGKFFGQLRQMFDKGGDAEKLSPKAEKTPFKPEGPNVEQLYDRIDYVFFTGPSSFRLSFNVGDMPFTLLLERRGLFWKVVRLQLPV